MNNHFIYTKPIVRIISHNLATVGIKVAVPWFRHVLEFLHLVRTRILIFFIFFIYEMVGNVLGNSNYQNQIWVSAGG